MEAQAQTVETITAVTQTATWYSGVAGPMAASWAMVAVGLCVLIWKMFQFIEKKNAEISELKVTCAKEIAQAKLDAEAEADAKVDMAWKRVQEIHNSVITLFGKCDTSNASVAGALSKLTTVMATKGVFAND